MEKINFGVIGAGRLGRIHTKNLVFNIPEANVEAIADPLREET